jgi:hypothetical protein
MLPNKTTPANYGLPKSNFDYVVDPNTEIDVLTEYEPLVVDVSALTYVAPRAWIRVNADSSAPTIVSHSAMWGDANGVVPTLTRNATGNYTVSWATAYNDMNPTPARQTSRSVNFLGAQATREDTAGFIRAFPATANTVNVFTSNATNVADDEDFFLVVY